ncbi:hypothetical protein J4E85_005726 [Alternaria conjuncta]|uniref:uncharacterized protein n=1 Tax=Alternaria conjuncta TaxID=181017 RepID=UPI0022201646|nr:uncharacterized protein J4E85_005726 [Alternaria conjuncta]KAI4929102.1 hypothetical protein J4E85_005726 [Alternaria conjuncta]
MTQPPQRAPTKRTVPKIVAPKPPANPKKEKRYPFDSHQDDIVVNTTELDTAPGYRRGLVDYRHKLTLKKTYAHITTDYAEDMKMTIPKDAITPLGSEARDDGDGDGDEDEDDDEDGDEKDDEKPNANAANPKSKRDERTYVPEVSDTIIDYTKLPKPRCNRPNYVEYIYRATTTNPAVFLAILRVAERNLPFINFDSAITHLPNLLANARLPGIPALSALSSESSDALEASASSNHPQKKKANPPAFTEDTPHEKKDADIPMTILFLPNLYKDGRHALGYYALAPEADPDTKQLNPEDVVQILFTPCGISDLVEARLLEWTPIDPDLKARADEKKSADKKGDALGGGDGKGDGDGKGGDAGDGDEEEELTVEYIEHVAARGGEWLERDVVGDWEEWCRSFRVARRVWEKVLKGVVEVREVEDVKEEIEMKEEAGVKEEAGA